MSEAAQKTISHVLQHSSAVGSLGENTGYRYGTRHVTARSKRARRNVALQFWPRKHVLSTQQDFLIDGRALDRGQRMLELWNNWYETLASMEAFAAVIVIVVVAAGVISLAESRRR